MSEIGDHSGVDLIMPRHPKVCYFGTYRGEYPRNVMSIEGLRRAGAQVSVCQETLWMDVTDRIKIASGGWLNPAFWQRVVRSYWRLIKKYRAIGEYDIMVVGYPGHYDVYLARILSQLRNKPLVWDVYNSLYLIMSERGITQSNRATARIVRFLENVAIRLPDLMLLDSQEFIDWFKKTYQVSGDKFRILPIGADKDELPIAFRCTDHKKKEISDGIFWVVYYGTYITNHGVNTIIEAASLLKNIPQIRFKMIGVGPEREKAEQLVMGNKLNNVIFIDWLEKPELSLHLAQAGVCLGSLGDTLQAHLTNNNKIYEAFSMKIPVITGKSPALPDSLVDHVHIYLCERNNPQALANAITELLIEIPLRQALGNNGYKILSEKFDTIPLGKLLLNYLEEIQKYYAQ